MVNEVFKSTLGSSNIPENSEGLSYTQGLCICSEKKKELKILYAFNSG